MNCDMNKDGNSLKKLIIFGAGGFGREVAWLAEKINIATPTWNILGFIDDTKELQGKTVGGYPILGMSESIVDYADAYFVCAVGSAKVRKKIIQKLEGFLPSIKYATLIDPSVLLSDRVSIGSGSIICAGTIITVDVELGKHIIINLDCTIGHDAIINDYVTLYPSVNVSGKTELAECVEMGTGTQIIQGKTVGEGTIVGAGAVVVRDLPAGCTAVGSPAKSIKFHEGGSNGV